MKKNSSLLLLFGILMAWSTSVLAQSVAAAVAPSVPQVTGLNVGERTNNTIYLFWDPVSVASTYTVEWTEDTTGTWNNVSVPASAGPAFLVNQLTKNTVFYFRVKAVGTPPAPSTPGTSAAPAPSSIEGAYSTIVSARTLSIPNSPSNLSATQTSGKVILNWKDNSDNENRFQVYLSYDGVSFLTIPPVFAPSSTDSSVSFIYGGLPENSDVFFRVSAENSDGISEPSPSIRLITVPGKVSTVIAEEIGLDYLYAYWIPFNSNFAGRGYTSYEFDYKEADAPRWSSVSIPASAGPAAIIRNLTPGKKYFIRARALNLGGRGDDSDVVELITKRRERPNAASNLTTQVVSDSSINVSWTLGAEDLRFFTNTRFGLEIEVFNADTSFFKRVTVDTKATSSLVTGLKAKTAYLFRINSANEVGEARTAFVVDTTLGIPAAPSLLAGTSATDALGDAIVNLTWKDNASNEAAILVHVLEPGKQPFPIKLAPNTEAFTHTPIQQGITYQYVVFSQNEFGNSATSDTISVEVGYISAPNAPYNLKATLVDGKPSLTWLDDSFAEEKFEVERSSANSTFAVVGTVGRNVTSFVDLTAVAGTSYSYRVKAVNPIGSSDASNTVTITATAAAAGFVVFPNPTVSSVTVDMSNTNAKGTVQVNIIDQTNRVVRSQKFRAQEGVNVDMSSLREGVYTISVSGDGVKMSKKVVKN